MILYHCVYRDMKSLWREDAVMFFLLYLAGFTRWENKPLTWTGYGEITFLCPVAFFFFFFFLN